MTRAFFNRSAMMILLLLLTACTTLRPDFESPVVTVNSFRLSPSSGLNPSFDIDLHIINPNNIALPLQGLSYTASIEGHQILAGVANNLPTIAAYGEGDVSLSARTSLFAGISLLKDLMRLQKDSLSYQLKVKLDVGSFVPSIYTEQSGVFSLSGQNR